MYTPLIGITDFFNREFFYLNIERFARKLVSGGVQSIGIHGMTTEHALLKTLTAHYNRGTDYEVGLSCFMMGSLIYLYSLPI